MRAWVSPPQLRSSYIVQTTASMAHAASTALPPRSKILAPAVAPSGLPVIATQWRPWRTGLWVVEDGSGAAAPGHEPATSKRHKALPTKGVRMLIGHYANSLSVPTAVLHQQTNCFAPVLES